MMQSQVQPLSTAMADELEFDRLLQSVMLENGPTPICCCSFIDESLEPTQHLADCELQYMMLASDLDQGSRSASHASDSTWNRGSISDTADTSASAAKRRKHRESMARLRQKLRDSIGRLQLQEQRLVRDLRLTVDRFQPHTRQHQHGEHPGHETQSPPDVRCQLRQAYFELVKEQLALQDERQALDNSWSQKVAYERLVARELDRMKDSAQTMMSGTERSDTDS